MAITVDTEGAVRVAAPIHVSSAAVAAFVQARASWIEKQRAASRARPTVPKRFVDGESLFFLGREYALRIHAGTNRHTEVRLEGRALAISVPQRHDTSEVRAAAVVTGLEGWYRRETSIGQEGLDFHPYCHAVVHWDLPSNPVDLEQREGRVHRYKGHAVRKNVAAAFGPRVLRELGQDDDSMLPDPWERTFAHAVGERPPDATDLVPFWISQPPEGVEGAAIERHVLALPLSREHGRLADLRRSLAVYRMAFGQPRQEDLVEYLLEHVPQETVEAVLDELRVDLSPPAGRAKR